MTDQPLKLLVLGAHPDDADIHAGGLVSIYRQLGHQVKMISVTNGESGHHEIHGSELVAVRRKEAAASGAVTGATYEVWENPDGRLQSSLEVREQVIRELRTFAPDLVLTHRTNDYHPDHRAVGNVVRDASYMVTVPAVAPDVPSLRKDPVVAFMPDSFTKPTPLQGDVVVDVTEHVETVVDMLHCHTSQMYEWLPYNRRCEAEVPQEEAERRAWMRPWYLDRVRPFADRYRAELVKTYGPIRGSEIEYCEVYEISEYAASFDEAARRRLFPFLPF
ncbi:MAG: PIG-L family deacetylase [Planctomycetales bacterium]